MIGHVPRHSLGGLICHTKRFVGNVDRTMRTASGVYGQVKHLVPDGRIKTAAEKSLSGYNTIREAIQSNRPLL